MPIAQNLQKLIKQFGGSDLNREQKDVLHLANVVIAHDEKMLALKEALHDLWGCIGSAEIQHLQPETIQMASQIHEEMCHGGETQ